MGKPARKTGRAHEEPEGEHGEPVQGLAVRWSAERSTSITGGLPREGKRKEETDRFLQLAC